MPASTPKELGPLGQLIGVWEGEKGDDISPADDRGTENNKFKERMVFEPLSPVQNHEQTLHGLRYSTTAWRIGETDPFHEELGYWLWDPKEQQVLRCFLVPRGVSIIAGGTASANATSFTLTSELGSQTYGICSNQFLDREFKTIRYTLKLSVDEKGLLTYEEDTELAIKNQPKTFHHTDKNTLRRIK